MKGKGIDGDLIGWTAGILSNRTVEMLIEVNVVESCLEDARIPQGSPVTPIRLAIYTSGLITSVEESVSVIKGLSFVDDVGWVATGSDVSQVIRNLEFCAKQSIDWAEGRQLEIDTSYTLAPLITLSPGQKKHLPPKLTAKIRVGNGFVRFNKEATSWLGVWIGAHLSCKEHHN
jgi:hypothetical protein